MERRILCTLLLGTALLCTAVPATAQPLWVDIQDQSNISFEWLKSSYEFSNADFSFFTSTVYLSGSFVVSPSFRIIADIPFSSFSASYEGFFSSSVDESGSVLGNPYVGAEFGNDEMTFFAEGGIRLPTVNHNSFEERDAAELGAVADIMRYPAFVDDYIPMSIMLNGQPMWQGGKMRLRLRFGGWFFIPNEKHLDGETFFILGAYYTYDNRDFIVRIGYTGAINSEAEINFFDAWLDEFGVAVQKPFGDWVPGIMLRFPMGEPLNDFVNYTLGLNVAYRIR